MKITYHRETDFSNRAWQHLVSNPQALASYVDHPDSRQLPADLSPWMHTDVERQRVVEVLRARGGNEEACQKLLDPKCLVVLTGQQPGLGGGPLYTVYKTLTAIQYANWLEAKTKTPVAPLFCNLSDDHDWGEANRLALWVEGEIKTFSLPQEPEGAHLFEKRHPASLKDITQGKIEDVESDCLPFSEARTFSDFLSRQIACLFAGSGLLVFEPCWFRHLQSAFIKRVVENRVMIDQNLLMAGSALELGGYSKAITEGEGHYVMFAKEGKRQRLLEVGGKYSGRHTTLGDADTLNNLIDTKPDMFSTNVVSRPLWMRSLFPVVSEVVGPGEAAYQLQYAGIYSQWGLKAPVLTPRMSAVLLRQRDARRFESLDCPPWELSEALGSIPPQLQEMVRERLQGMKNLWNSLESQVGAELPAMSDKIAKAGKRLMRDMDRVPAMIERGYQLRDSERHTQVEALERWLSPLGKAQERVLSLTSVVAFAGDDWWTDFKAGVDALKRETAYVELDS